MKEPSPMKLEKIEAHRWREDGRERAGAAEKYGGGGRIIHVFSVHPFKGDLAVLVGERRELCSVDEVDKMET